MRNLSYLIYRFIAKMLPEAEELGPIGRFSHLFRSRICVPLFRSADRTIRVGRGAVFGNGCNIIMKDHANIGACAHISGSL